MFANGYPALNPIIAIKDVKKVSTISLLVLAGSASFAIAISKKSSMISVATSSASFSVSFTVLIASMKASSVNCYFLYYFLLCTLLIFFFLKELFF